MRKIFLTAIALLSMASASVFGMYGVDTDWIFFLTHGNQFRARLDQLGFTLGNDTIKGTFGFDNNAGYGGVYGSLLSENSEYPAQGRGFNYDFKPSISMGLGYTSSLISVGVGYNATIGKKDYKQNGNADFTKPYNPVTHTPVLVLNALDNAFRMAIPIQVYVMNDKDDTGTKNNITVVSVDSQFRYYTGLDALPQVRLFLRYGLYQNESKVDKDAKKEKQKYAESFGFDFRLYFGSMVEEVALQPLVKLAYNQALGNYHQDTKVEAVKAMNGDYNSYQSGSYGGSVWDLQLMTGLGLTANSDIVSLYLEPQLGLAVTSRAPIVATAPGGTPTPARVTTESYDLAYNVYAEIYITPLKNLEWYFEAQLGSGVNQNSLVFNGTTGITWYLPAL